MKRLFAITVNGKNHKWQFHFDGDENDWQDWLDDGLDVMMVKNIIPEWIVFMGLTKIWCFLQDIFQFRG